MDKEVFVGWINVHKIKNQTSYSDKVIWPCQNEVFQKSHVKNNIFIFQKMFEAIESAFSNVKPFYL